MNDWERCVGGRDKTANLSHHAHKGNRTDISALATHVAACNDLKSLPLSSKYIIGDEFVGLLNLWTMDVSHFDPFLSIELSSPFL